MIQINAGHLSMQYQKGFLRHIQWQERKVLDMIYFALRDANWKTIPLYIKDEKISQGSDSFNITYEAVAGSSIEIMAWKVEIEGKPDNSIHFHIQGKALTTFKKNRCGFCILHPVKENRGKNMIVLHPQAITEYILFPEYISPDVIATDMEGIQWKISDNITAKLKLLGDTFEMEDHRNWTDNSFKTYCTPLKKPFPVLMQINESVAQSVDLVIEGKAHGKTKMDKKKYITVEISHQKIPIAPIGIGRSDFHSSHLKHLDLLRTIGFSHYRVEITPGMQNWKTDFQDAMAEASLIETPMEIVFFFSDNYQGEIEDFFSLSVSPLQISHFVVLSAKNKYTDNAMLNYVVPQIKKYYPASLIGSGTDAFFAELNRSSFNDALIDFVTYSVNPQVHASDDETIIENLSAQQETIISARNRFPGKQIHISPVTLKSRYNPDATDIQSLEREDEDPRHKTTFGAGWLLGSLKYVLEEKIDRITYFETCGDLGLMDTDPAGITIFFPILKVFKTILDNKWKYLLASSCNEPTIISSLVLSNGKKFCFLLANHTQYSQTVEVSDSHNGIRFSKFLEPFQIAYKTV